MAAARHRNSLTAPACGNARVCALDADGRPQSAPVWTARSTGPIGGTSTLFGSSCSCSLVLSSRFQWRCCLSSPSRALSRKKMHLRRGTNCCPMGPNPSNARLPLLPGRTAACVAWDSRCAACQKNGEQGAQGVGCTGYSRRSWRAEVPDYEHRRVLRVLDLHRSAALHRTAQMRAPLRRKANLKSACERERLRVRAAASMHGWCCPRFGPHRYSGSRTQCEIVPSGPVGLKARCTLCASCAGCAAFAHGARTARVPCW